MFTGVSMSHAVLVHSIVSIGVDVGFMLRFIGDAS